MKEIWKNVYGFDVLYEVSNLGRVRTHYTHDKGYSGEYHYINPVDNGNGYLRFNWKIRGKQRTVYLHRLVAECFVENPNGYNEVNHKDENKANNSACNLEWCTHAYNANYGTAIQRRSEKRKKKVQCIETGVIYESASYAAVCLGCCLTAISNCLNGRSKSCSGYTWRYFNDAV